MIAARHAMPALLFCMLTLSALPARAAGDAEADIALQRALDQPLTLVLQKTELSEAFKQIASAAKISLQVDPACYDLLPYGPTTRVSVDFKQSKLRDALDEVLIPLGLQKSVSGNSVLIRPSNPLLHIGRRADWEELKLIKDLWTSADLKMPAAGPFNLPDAIRAALDGRKDLLVVMPGDPAPSPAPGLPPAAASASSEKALEQIARQLPMSAYRALEMYCQLTNQIWFVEAGAQAGGSPGGTIHIMSPKQWIVQRQLAKPIQIARTNEPLEVVVADLTHASGIRFVPEPGLYQAVPVVSLRSDNGTVKQTLEALAGATRIAFEVRDDSILLHLSPGPGGAPAPARSDTIVGRISVPVGPNGLMMDLFIREMDLSPDLNEQRKRHLQDAIDGLQKTWTAAPSLPSVPASSGPGTAVGPATRPAATAPATQATR